MASPFRGIILVALVSVLGLGIYDYLTNFEDNQCEMTYMYQLPEYLNVELDESIKEKFPKYNLFLYGEGEYAQKSKSFKLTGIPVLFIPGNAGSYKQVRSLASVAITKAEKKSFHFNYFSLDFNEELGALYGGYIGSQIEFTHAAIKHILSLYKSSPSPPKSVVLVGHSMGGMVARALFTLPDFDHSTVHTIITQATPHQRPVLALDSSLAQFYEQVNGFWQQEFNKSLSHVTMLSTGGGFRDILVPSYLTDLMGIHGIENAISTNTMSFPSGWVSTDHLCHVWCKQLVLATKRALFDMVDPKSKQIAVNPKFRMQCFYHHFIHNTGSKKVIFNFDEFIPVEDTVQWEVRKKPYWKINRKSLDKKRYSVVSLPFFDKQEFAMVAISNIANEAWIGGCKVVAKEEKCAQLTNFAPSANLIPPQIAQRKVVHLSTESLQEYSHVVTVLPKTVNSLDVSVELYNTTERNVEYNVSGFLGFWKRFPSSIMAEDVVVESTAANAVFYNITLNGFEIPLQAHTVHLECLSCSDAATAPNAGSVVKLNVPWSSNSHTYKFIKHASNGSFDLKLQSAMPAGFPLKAQLHLYLSPTCVYRVTIDTAFRQLFGQFVRFYGHMLPAFIVIQILMVLAWQLKSLEEEGIAPSFGAAHQRWAQPWRVVPLAMLLKFMITYPEEDNIAKKLGLPLDDTVALSKLNVWYPALPVMLYLSCYALMGLYGPLIHFILSIKAVILGPFFRCALNSPAMMRLVNFLRLLLFLVAILVSVQVCGSLGIVITYAIFAIQTMASYVGGRHLPGPVAMNKFHVYMTLSLLALCALALNASPFVAWMKNLDSSINLANDPSRIIGVTMSVVGLFITQSNFPVSGNEWYGVCGSLCYLSCIIMLPFALTSLYRITYFIQADFIILATVTTIVSIPSASPVKQKTN